MQLDFVTVTSLFTGGIVIQLSHLCAFADNPPLLRISTFCVRKLLRTDGTLSHEDLELGLANDVSQLLKYIRTPHAVSRRMNTDKYL